MRCLYYETTKNMDCPFHTVLPLSWVGLYSGGEYYCLKRKGAKYTRKSIATNYTPRRVKRVYGKSRYGE